MDCCVKTALTAGAEARLMLLVPPVVSLSAVTNRINFETTEELSVPDVARQERFIQRAKKEI